MLGIKLTKSPTLNEMWINDEVSIGHAITDH